MSVPLWRALELLSYRMLLFLDNVSDPLLWALSRTVDSGLHDLTFLFWKLCPNLGQGSWGPQYSWLAVHRAEPLSYGWEMVEEESSWPLGPTHQEFLNLKLKGIWNVGGLPFLVRYIKSLLGAKRKGGATIFLATLTQSGASIKLRVEKRRRSGLWLKCHRFLLLLPSFNMFLWINVFSFFVCPQDNFQRL